MKRVIELGAPETEITHMRAMLAFPNDVEQREALGRRFQLTDKIEKLSDDDEVVMSGRDLKFLNSMHDSLRVTANVERGVWQTRLAGSQLFYYWALHAAGRETSHAKAMIMVKHQFHGTRYNHDNSLISVSEKHLIQCFRRSHKLLGIAAAYEFLYQNGYVKETGKSPYKDVDAFVSAMSFAEAFIDFGMSHIAKKNYKNNKPILHGTTKIFTPRSSFFKARVLPTSIDVDLDALRKLDAVARKSSNKKR